MKIVTPPCQRRRPPLPVTIAAALAALGSFLMLAVGLLLLVTVNASTGWILLLLAAVAAALAHGLWRGNRGALIVGSLVTGAILLLGLREFAIAGEPAELAVVLVQVAGAAVMLGLLLIPASSRAYFRG